MLYFLFQYLESKFQIPGAGLFQYLSFRSALAFIFSLFISIKFSYKIISYLRKKQIGETIRDLGLKGQMEKRGTPTMGGIIIIISTILPVFLVSLYIHRILLVLLVQLVPLLLYPHY